MNNAINEIRNTLGATNSRITEAEDSISIIEDRMVEINESARKLHNKEDSTNCQNTERPPQTQQYKQDEETEEYTAGKGT